MPREAERPELGPENSGTYGIGYRPPSRYDQSPAMISKDLPKIPSAMISLGFQGSLTDLPKIPSAKKNRPDATLGPPFSRGPEPHQSRLWRAPGIGRCHRCRIAPCRCRRSVEITRRSAVPGRCQDLTNNPNRIIDQERVQALAPGRTPTGRQRTPGLKDRRAVSWDLGTSAFGENVLGPPGPVRCEEGAVRENEKAL